MKFCFTEKSKVEIKMDDYVEIMSNEFPMKTSKSYADLNKDKVNLFKKYNRKSLVKKETEEFHTLVSK